VFSISAAAKQPEAAYRFLRWAAGEEEAVIRGLLGHLTPCTATFESALLNRYYPGLSLMNAARYSAGLRQVIRRGDQTEVDHARLEGVMAAAITAALKGELTPSEALAQAQQQVVSLLEKQN